MSGGEDGEKEAKEPNREKKTVKQKKCVGGVMIKAEEKNERFKDWIFLPPPLQERSRERREMDVMRPGPCVLHAQGARGTDTPGRAETYGREVIPQSEMATKAPAQWYPFVKAVAIKGP